MFSYWKAGWMSNQGTHSHVKMLNEEPIYLVTILNNTLNYILSTNK